MGRSEDTSSQDAIEFASMFMISTAAKCWYAIVSENIVPPMWEASRLSVEAEFVPKDTVIRSRDKLTKLRQGKNAAAYLLEFRNSEINIPGKFD